MSPQTVFHPFVLGYTMMSMHGFSRGFGALQHPVFARRMPQPSPLTRWPTRGMWSPQTPPAQRAAPRPACCVGGARAPQAAGGRRQAIVLKAINLNPVRMDQHPRGAPACFEQVLEESLETAPARVHRTNGLARHAALCAILAVGLPVFCSLMTTTCFAHSKTTRRWLAPEL